jgi:2-iminoacetate synthase
MPFSNEIKKFSWDEIEEAIFEASPQDVEWALGTNKLLFKDTVQRFGRVIQMYAPLYVSSECTNSCVYCGFNRNNAIERDTLTIHEVISEAETLHNQGFRHLLLVSGESPRHVHLDYLTEISKTLRPMFSSLSIEVYPMDVESYSTLVAAGVDGLTIYQETYHPGRYKEVHPAGRKRDYGWRLDTPDRGGQAGIRRLNIGVLLGLSDWRVEAAFMALHADYLARRYWRSHVSVSFPRLRPAAGGYEPACPVSDAHMIQLMCALRLWMPEAGLVISTREPAELRDNLVPLGVTQMSAGSKTALSDHRSPGEVVRMIASRGYEPVWKDWDQAFLDPSIGQA